MSGWNQCLSSREARPWSFIVFLVASTLVGAGCSKGETGSLPAEPKKQTCVAPAPQVIRNADFGAQESSSSSSLSLRELDPYKAFGKVVLASGHATRRLSAFAARAESTLPKGLELSITIDENCAAHGVISRAVLAQNAGARTTTPSGQRSYTYRLLADMTSEKLVELADADACVVGVSESLKSYLTSEIATAADPNSDPMAKDQGHLAYLNVWGPEASKGRLIPDTASGVLRPIVIAVVDTGIDLQHEDLKQVLWINPNEIAGNGIDDDKNGYVDDVYGYNFPQKIGSPQHAGTWSGRQHGTHVSGLAAAQGGNGKGITGVMGSGARIMALNVFGNDSGAYSSDAANAIRYAADNGADVINLSIGGNGRSATYESAIAYAIRKGVVIVAAAGNERRELGDDYFMAPGGYGRDFEGMISIGSVDSSNGKFSVFSNFGARYVELAAPGSEESTSRKGLLSTWPGDGYSRLQGTSMASPVAAGAAAFAIRLMRERGYMTSPATIEALLATSSKVDRSIETKISGGRIVNVENLAMFINATYPVTTVPGKAEPEVPGYQPSCPQTFR